MGRPFGRYLTIVNIRARNKRGPKAKGNAEVFRASSPDLRPSQLQPSNRLIRPIFLTSLASLARITLANIVNTWTHRPRLPAYEPVHGSPLRGIADRMVRHFGEADGGETVLR
jgi:hypothetical protein